jgi:hypothetical protein
MLMHFQKAFFLDMPCSPVTIKSILPKADSQKTVTRRYSMHIRRIFQSLVFLVVAMMILHARALGQGWQLDVTVQSDPPPYVSDWKQMSGIAVLVLTNPDLTVPTPVRIVTEAFQNVPLGTPVFKSRIDKVLMPASVIMLNNTDLVEFDIDQIDESLKDRVIRSGRLPEGMYYVCVTVLDPASGAVYVRKKCASFRVTDSDPVKLLWPENAYAQPLAQYPEFSWTPISSAADVAITYKFKLVELLAGQNPLQAIDANQPHFESADVGKFLLQYPMYAQELVEGKSYAWRVQAIDQNDLPAARNKGFSDVWTFTFRPAAPTVPKELAVELLYPADRDTIPWIPPQLIARFRPFSDSVTALSYTLTVKSESENFEGRRSFTWPKTATKGPSGEQALTLLLTQETESPATPFAWTKNLKRGTRYTWSVEATGVNEGEQVRCISGERSFVLGATAPQNVSTTLGRDSVNLSWENELPVMVNPTEDMTGSQSMRNSYSGSAMEWWAAEVSHDSTFKQSEFIAAAKTPMSTSGSEAAGVYGIHTLAVPKRDTGGFFWRPVWLQPDLPASTNTPYLAGPVGSIRVKASRSTCSTEEPEDKVPAERSFTVGEVVTIGKFSMELTAAEGTGAKLKGAGLIKIPFLKCKLEVVFDGLSVNAKGEVFAGEVKGKQSAESPLSDEQANGLGAVSGLDSSRVRTIHGIASDAKRLVSAFSGSTPMTLPIGLDRTIDQQKLVVAIIGIVFTPTEAQLNAAMSYQFPELGPDMGIGLGARNVCFSPTGLSQQATLYLAENFGYRPDTTSWGFTFLKSAQDGSGSFITFDQNGFKEFRVEAEVQFPRDWLKPFPDDGHSLVKTKFMTAVQTGGNFLVGASLDRCEITSAPGWTLQVQDMVFDWSDKKNPDDMKFPAGYSGVSDSRWKGFYIRRATIPLPPELRTFDSTQPPQISVNDLLIAKGGFCGSIRAENIFHYPNGNFGGWGGSLDTLAIDFVNSSMRRGMLTGRIKLPIAEEPLKYSAILSRPASTDSVKGMAYTFVIRPSDSLTADLWKAKLHLEPTTNITLTNDNPERKFVASATLDGSLTIEGTIGGLPQVKIPGLSFQGMKLQTVKPYFTKGSFGFASPEKGLAGFPVSISGVDFQQETRNGKDLAGLALNISINLAPGARAISGNTTLKFWGELVQGGGQRFRFFGVELDTIGVDADLGPVKIAGGVNFYREDPIFGTGFRGAVRADFLQKISVTSTVQFGKVGGYRYFYVDAKGMFRQGIPFGTTGVGFYGLGGGFWWNMRRVGSSLPAAPTTSAVASAAPGATASGFQFVPSEGSFGFKAMVTIGTHPSPASFNADVALDVDLQNTSGGVTVGRITLQGNGYMMAELTARQKARVTMYADILYDFPRSTLHGVFNVTINATPVSGGGQAVLHAEPATWYIKVGEPDKRMQVTLADWLRTGGYLMLGRDLPPPPPPPSEVTRILGPVAIARDTRITAGNGFAFGASLSLNTGRQRYAIFYGEFSAGGGFDIAMMQQYRCAGINNWYAQGQLYAYVRGSVGLDVSIGFWMYKPCGPWYCRICRWCQWKFIGVRGSFEILGISAAALLQAGGPNPLWVQGTVGGRYSILGGLVSGHCSFNFTKGTVCRL